MIPYVLRRILALVPTWLGISLLAFTLASFSPGDPAQLILSRQQSEPVTAEQLQAFRERNGLDDPFVVQYVRWVANALVGDLGTSYRTGAPVLGELASRVPGTLQITLPAFVFTVAFAVTVGVLSALRHNTIADHSSRVVALVADSVPSFVVAYVLILLFSVGLGVLPVSGRGGWEHMVLPVLTLTFAASASLMRLTRSSLLDVLGEDYIRTAVAMGLRQRTVILDHALRNAIIPLVTVAGLLFAGFTTGVVIVETVFGWPGVGKFVVDSIFDRDYPVIQGFVVFTGTVFVLINLLVDVIHLRLDPRVRLAATGSSGGD